MSTSNPKRTTHIQGNVEKVVTIGTVQGNVIIANKEEAQAKQQAEEQPSLSLLDEVFSELQECISAMFTHAGCNQVASCVSELTQLKNKLSDLRELGLEQKRILAIDYYIEGLKNLLEAYTHILSGSDLAQFHEILAQKFDESACCFQDSKTRIGKAFSLFFKAWALIKRTKPLYSDPSQLGIVIERHKREIPEMMIEASEQFQDHPMAAFANGEANYSIGWAFVFESFSGSTILHQAKLLEEAANYFKFGSEFYAKANIDISHKTMAEADHCLFQGIAFALLAQRQSISQIIKNNNLQKARDLLVKSLTLFYSIGRLQLAYSISKIVYAVEKERETVTKIPIKEKRILDEILQSFLLNEHTSGIDVLKDEILNITDLQAISRIPEMFLNSTMFIEAISIIRKSDQEDLEEVLLQTLSSNIPAMLTAG